MASSPPQMLPRQAMQTDQALGGLPETTGSSDKAGMDGRSFGQGMVANRQLSSGQ